MPEVLRAWRVTIYGKVAFVAAASRSKAEYIVAKMAAEAFGCKATVLLDLVRGLRAPKLDIIASTLDSSGVLSSAVDQLCCQVTKNPCGTDTWMIGHPCECKHCRAYLTLYPDDRWNDKK